jgi:signal transduction histidine kinase
MAIKKDSPVFIRNYYPSLWRHILIIIVVTQFITASIIISVLILSRLVPASSIMLWVIIGILLLIGLSSSILVFTCASRPLKDLLVAITHTAGEPTDQTLPNPNNKKYAKNGLGEALQTIYKLAATDHESADSITEKTSALPTSMLDNITTGLVALNHKRNIIYNNKAAPVRIRLNNSLTLELMFNGNDSLDAWLDDCDANAVHATRVWTRIPNKLPDEENRHLFDVIASYEKGRPAETVLTLVDRTSTYTIDEEDLNFIAFAAHELRGPITVIRGYLDILEDELEPVLQNDQHELFHRLTVSANRLSSYINNILNTSRYDRRHLKVRLVEDTVAQVYDTIADDINLRASSQNRILSVNLPADLPTIAADRESLSEVFSNLIDNAIKYSNEGGVINVTASVQGDFVDISVEDHGIGMTPDVIGKLFHKFYRSHRSRETVAGTGIGLYVSKAIIESHGGTISVRSKDGEGSVFTISLPKYETIAHKLVKGDNSNEGLIKNGSGWIKNHSMYRG